MFRKSLLSLSVALCVASLNVSANDEVYYQIGGGQVNDSTLKNFNSFNLKLDPYVSGNYSCGNFDVQESVKSLVRDLSSIPDEFADYLEVAVVDLLLGIAALSLQKAAPGVYEFLTNAYARHKEYVEIRLASCREIENDIQSGEISGFKDLAKMVSWRRSAETGTSIQDAEATANSDAGVPWIDGNAGGFGQEPIKIVGDSITAGYNNLFGTGGGPEADTGLASVEFPDADSAKEWAVKVLGEKSISFITDSNTDAGGGLISVISPEEEELLVVINAVIANPSTATADQLDSLSTPFYRVTPSVLSSINSNPTGTRNIIINRLASEIATYKNIERAFFIRTVLRSAIDHPSIAFHNEAPRMIREVISKLDDDIRVARDRSSVRKEFVGNLLVFSLGNSKDIEVNRSPVSPSQKPRETLPDGSVIQK